MVNKGATLVADIGFQCHKLKMQTIILYRFLYGWQAFVGLRAIDEEQALAF